MAHWTNKPTNAHLDAKSALGVVDGLLSFMTTGRGKPSTNERSLFAATVVFSYGVWESYAEQLAIEIVERVAYDIDPSRVPEPIHKRIEKGQSVWSLAVAPGWQKVWTGKVTKLALGDDDSYGLNTARAGQVRALLEFAGVRDAFEAIDDDIVPPHLKPEVESAIGALSRFVDLRGEIVHTANVPDSLKKPHAREWRDFVEALVDQVDAISRSQTKKLLG